MERKKKRGRPSQHVEDDLAGNQFHQHLCVGTALITGLLSGQKRAGANTQAVRVLSECSARSVRPTCASQLRGAASSVSTSSKAKTAASRHSNEMKSIIQMKYSNEMLKNISQIVFNFQIICIVNC
ncbi:hypothetical protein ATANTOWER_020894 [Ataeniobius toweri]|uniref:Uncharacterized protein n=1 Tax=Ataeniobius toweri TaxID=208326 RepID=A0ABU7B1G2_9TELE|nr:hypothetical protein [Ataeniobius toweri]